MAPTRREWTTQDILDKLAHQRVLLSEMGVQKIGLFGSYRRGTATAESDMDFLVMLEDSTFDSYMAVKIYLEDLFGCKIDLVLEKTIKPSLRPYILAEVVYAA